MKHELCAFLFTIGLCACGGNGGGSAMSADDDSAESELPPATGFQALEVWLAKGYYKSWHCEAAPHEARSPSPHGINRICNNAKVAAQGAGKGEYPVGAANVKELYDVAGTTIVGYSVAVHLTAGNDTANWYWYERNPALGLPAKNGSSGLVADGVGPNEGVAGTVTQKVCTGCHAAAGSDASHTTMDSHDFVYTHVP